MTKKAKLFIKVSLLFIYFILNGLCCYCCVESLYLSGVGLRKLSIGLIVFPFICIFTVAIKNLYSIATQTMYSNRRTTVLGSVMIIILGLLLIVPCQTHTLYYKNNIEREVLLDLITTKEYLQRIQVQDTHDKNNVVAQIERIENAIVDGQLKLNKDEDVVYIDSILLVGYNTIKENKHTERILFHDNNDKIRYTQAPLKTRIERMKNIFGVWGRPLIRTYPISFLCSLITSLVSCTFMSLSFLLSMKHDET